MPVWFGGGGGGGGGRAGGGGGESDGMCKQTVLSITLLLAIPSVQTEHRRNSLVFNAAGASCTLLINR